MSKGIGELSRPFIERSARSPQVGTSRGQLLCPKVSVSLIDYLQSAQLEAPKQVPAETNSCAQRYERALLIVCTMLSQKPSHGYRQRPTPMPIGLGYLASTLIGRASIVYLSQALKVQHFDVPNHSFHYMASSPSHPKNPHVITKSKQMREVSLDLLIRAIF